MGRRRAFITVTLALTTTTFVAADAARADRLVRRDGTVLAGKARQVDGGYEITGDNGLKKFVPSTDIASIKIENTGRLDEATARERFESLRRSSENERDVGRAIERYEAILAQTEGTTAAGDARKELATWRDRRDRKMIRVGKNWLTPEEHDALFSEIARRADGIRAALADGNLNEAAAQLRDASTLDPDNMSFLYLTGVMQYRRGQFAEAKRSFDAVADQVPDHAPTLINQAALLVHYKRWPQAAAALDAAMAAAPENAEILDNVTEFIQMLPDGSRKSNVVDRMMKRYGVQEAALEQRMAEGKRFRWGSGWVDEAKLADLRKQLDAHEQTKREMQTEFDQANERLRQIDEDATRTTNTLRQMEREQFYRDAETGRTIRRQLPQAYWDFTHDLEVLKNRRREEQAKVDELKKKAEQVEKSAPAAPYRGSVEPIGEAGVPVLLPASATQPSTRPAPVAATQPVPTGGQAFIPFRPGAAATRQSLD